MSGFRASVAFDMDDFIQNGSLLEFFDSGTVTTGNATTLIIDYSDSTMSERLSLGGTFSNYVDGFPTSGTVSTIQYSLNGSVVLTATELSITVQQFRDFVVANDLQGLFEAIYVGDDIIAGDNGDEVLHGFAGNDIVRGGPGDDHLFGDDGNDLLSEYSADTGLFGNDIYDGGNGRDRVSFFDPNGGGVTVNLTLATAQATGQGSDTLIGIEDVTATYGNDTLTGNAGDNWFWTFGGSDNLSGGAGADYFTVGAGDKVVAGGAGVDTLEIADFATVPVYTAAGIAVSLALQGSAQAVGTGNWTLSGIENLGGYFGNDELTGDGAANILAGGTGDDWLEGAGGNDRLLGDGYFMIDDNGVQLAIDDVDPGQPGGNDTLVGGAGDDYLNGGAGNDVIESGAGNDTLIGGSGYDTADYGGATGAVTISLANTAGQATGGSGTDTLTGIEHLGGSNFGDNFTGNGNANSLYGRNGDDTLIGAGGNDLLDGGAGNDVMRGGIGDDSYVIAGIGDRALEDSNAGFDTVFSSVNFTLGLNVEDLVLLGTALKASGNGLDNRLAGNERNNTLNGRGGADAMTGGLGNDIYYVDNAGDQAIEDAGQGRDRVWAAIDHTLGANLEDLFLVGSAAIDGTGNSLANLIQGNDAANAIRGAGGKDMLRGRGGADSFVFADGDFSGTTGSTCDRILDFTRAQGDSIDLGGVDANSAVAGDQAFTFIGTQGFHGVAGELRYTQNATTTFLTGDVNGDGTADFMIRVDGLINLAAGDFTL